MPSKAIKVKISAGLKQLRSKKGLSSRLARHLGISRQAISSWPVVPLDRLREVEKFTGISREKLRPDLYAR